MQIIYPITLHLDRREPCPMLDAVQGENGRFVAISLLKDGQPWDIPADAHVVVRYARPDACGGIYDTLPDGSAACTVQNNVITAQLVSQALAVAGVVSVQLAIVSGDTQLATFIFHVRVESDPSVGTAAGEEYVNLLPQVVQGIADAKEAAMVAKAYAEQAEITAASISTRYALTFAAHGLDTETGAAIDSSRAIASGLFPVVDGKLGAIFSTLVRVRLFVFDRNMNLTWVDTEQTEPFEYTDLPGAFARLEVSYNGNNTVPDVQDLADEVSVYIPNTSAQDAQDAAAAAQRAEAAAQRAENATPGGSAGANGLTPHIGENGNWWIGEEDTGVCAGGGTTRLNPLRIYQEEVAKGVPTEMIVYDGTEFCDVTLQHGFKQIYQPMFGTPYYLDGLVREAPAVINGTFKPTASADESYTFTRGYLFSDPAEGAAPAAMILDPVEGKIWHFTFAEDSYTVKSSAIGASGGGGGLAVHKETIVSEEAVNGITVTLPVELGKFVQFDAHFTFPNVTTAFRLYYRQGNSNYKGLYQDVPVCGTDAWVKGSGAHLRLAPFMKDNMLIQAGVAALTENARPVQFDGVYGTTLPEKSITFYSNTAGVDFPAGTYIDITGVYEQ